MSQRGRAGYAVRKAIKSGQLPALNGSIACFDCGNPATAYDHRNYDHPLTVQPVCGSCNKKRGPAEGWTPKKKHCSPLNTFRVQMQLTIDDVVKRSDLTYWQVVRALNGTTEKLSVMKKICRALGLDIADVIGR